MRRLNGLSGHIRGRGRHIAALGVVVLFLASDCRQQAALTFLDIATTPSLKNSGVLEAIAPAFSAAKLHVHGAGSGRALEMLADQVVDIALTHAPEAEERYVAARSTWVYRKFAYSRFVIVGPSEDPADVRRASNAVEAFRRMAACPMSFVSRGDESGTHERERALWKAAGVTPASDRLVVSGGGMAKALLDTHERQGYTLTDEATFRQMRSRVNLEIVLTDDTRLLNTYAIVYAEGNRVAHVFSDWLTRGDGRAQLANYAVADTLAFTPWPARCPADRPGVKPCPNP